MKYSEATLRYFYNTFCSGELDIQDVAVRTGEAGYLKNGDKIKFFCRVEMNQIKLARFQAYGSVATLACAQFACEWLQNKAVNEVSHLNAQQLVKALELPTVAFHSAVLVEKALKQIIC